MKILKQILFVIAGALAALAGAQIIKNKQEQPQKWQDAWDNSSTPAGEVLGDGAKA
jgi:hypothetical protein